MNNIKYNIALICANIMFGANYSIYSSLIGKDLSSNQLYALRIIVSALFFIPVMFIMGKYKIKLNDIYKFLAVAVMLVFGRIYLMLKGMNYTSPIDGSIIATMGPILIMIIAAMTIKEKITKARAVGIALGASGAIMLIFSSAGGHSLASGKTLGNTLILLSILLSSANTVYVKSLFTNYSPYTVMGWVYAIGVIVVLPVFAKDLTKIDLSSWHKETYGMLTYMLLGGTVLATFLLYYGLKGVGATASSVYVYIQPVVATTLAVFRGQDKITSVTLISAALIFTGVIFVIKSNKNKSLNTHVES